MSVHLLISTGDVIHVACENGPDSPDTPNFEGATHEPFGWLLEVNKEQLCKDCINEWHKGG